MGGIKRAKYKSRCALGGDRRQIAVKMWHNNIFHTILAAISVIICLASTARAEPNYRIVVEALNMHRSKNKDPVVTMKYIKIDKYNSTTCVINAAATVHKDIPLDAIVEVTSFQMKANKDYSKIPVKLGKGSLCDFIRDDKLFYEDIVAVSNMPRYCPIKAGEYKADDFLVRPNNMPDELPGERWRLDINVMTKQRVEIWFVEAEIYINRQI